MIYFDVTKTSRAAHRSGLTRVSARLREEIGSAAVSVAWRDGSWRKSDSSEVVRLEKNDSLLTAELFSEEERPGFWNFVKKPPCRLAAIFHDAIPLRHPHITWPKSVARHPEYMKMLAAFDRIFAVSTASAADLRGFWTWQKTEVRATVETVSLGADFLKRERPVSSSVVSRRQPTGDPSVLCVGIVEPRKNQGFLLDVCAALWAEGLVFDLNIVGRVNPHFGEPIREKIMASRKAGARVRHYEGVDDDGLLELYRTATATVFPTIAEGCGLPLLESLWLGVPCVCSDLPVLRENADGGGCVATTMNDKAAWKDALRRVLTDAEWRAQLGTEAEGRVLPTWRGAAEMLVNALRA